MSAIAALLEKAPAVIAAAQDETSGVTEALISTIEGQLALLRSAQ